MKSLRLCQHQAQIGQFLIKTLGIFSETFPGGDQLSEQAVVNPHRQGAALTDRALTERAELPMGLDERSQAELAVRIEEFDLTDLAQIKPDRISGQFRYDFGTTPLRAFRLRAGPGQAEPVPLQEFP